MVKLVDRGCEGFSAYADDVGKVEPFEARKYVVGQTAFYNAYCAKAKK